MSLVCHSVRKKAVLQERSQGEGDDRWTQRKRQGQITRNFLGHNQGAYILFLVKWDLVGGVWPMIWPDEPTLFFLNVLYPSANRALKTPQKCLTLPEIE